MYSLSLLNKCACFHFSWRKILVQSKFKSSRVLLYDSQIFIFSTPIELHFFKTRIISREVALLYIDDPNDRFLLPAEIRKRNVSMTIYDRSPMAITWLSYKVILCKLYLHNISPSLLSDVLRVRESLSIPQLFWLKQFTFFFSRYFKFGAHTSWYTSQKSITFLRCVPRCVWQTLSILKRESTCMFFFFFFIKAVTDHIYI